MADQTPSFLRSVLSGPDGSGSTARFCTLLVVLFSCLWVTYLVLRHTALPPFGELTIWDTSMIAALYGTNKITGAIVAKKADCDA